MTPKAKSSLINLLAFVGAVVAVTGITGLGAVQMVDRHFVRADTFREYRIQQAGSAALDSLKHEHELEKIANRLDSQDTILREVRAAVRRMEQRGR